MKRTLFSTAGNAIILTVDTSSKCDALGGEYTSEFIIYAIAVGVALVWMVVGAIILYLVEEW